MYLLWLPRTIWEERKSLLEKILQNFKSGYMNFVIKNYFFSNVNYLGGNGFHICEYIFCFIVNVFSFFVLHKLQLQCYPLQLPLTIGISFFFSNFLSLVSFYLLSNSFFSAHLYAITLLAMESYTFHKTIWNPCLARKNNINNFYTFWRFFSMGIPLESALGFRHINV